MTFKNLFKQHNNQLENSGNTSENKANVPNDMCVICPKCGANLFKREVAKNHYVCTECKFYFKIPSRTRLNMIIDSGSFDELNADMTTANLLDFPEYDEKLKTAAQKSGENEAVITGTAMLNGYPIAVFIMDPIFMTGSMGTVVGEKITQLFEWAIAQRLPVIGYTVSGGARMQEGILSLMQMAKISGAVKRHSDAGLFYVTVLTDPTTGGVTASFAMLGDVTLSEPNALICFAGPRVIEQTIRQKLPDGFQRAEFLFEKGFIDDIIERADQKEYLTKLLKIHSVGRND